MGKQSKNKVDKSKTEAEEKPKSKLREKKVLPGVDYLLKYGDPEKEGQPKEFWDIYFFPVFCCVTFILSFFVFYYFIENHTTHKSFELPRMKGAHGHPKAEL
jgi:hypothetical protein